jgi:hypothetical protein
MAPFRQNQSVKTFIKNIEEQGFRFYCVSCKRERRQSPPAKVGSPLFYGHILLTTAFFSLLTWPWMHWKGLFAFLIPVGLVLEAVYRLKMRAAMVCPDCNFDPILFLVNREKAIAQVEETWRKKFEEKGFPYPEKRRSGAPRKRSLDLGMTSGVNQGHGN